MTDEVTEPVDLNEPGPAWELGDKSTPRYFGHFTIQLDVGLDFFDYTQDEDRFTEFEASDIGGWAEYFGFVRPRHPFTEAMKAWLEAESQRLYREMEHKLMNGPLLDPPGYYPSCLYKGIVKGQSS